jgi:UDP-glucose 4-epimerase
MSGSTRVLLLGGAGFLGRAILSRVRAFPDLDVDYADLGRIDSHSARFVPVDVLSREACIRVLPDYDFIINLTGQITSPTNLAFRLNTEGVDHIVGAIRDTSTRLLHVSSVAVYGRSEAPVTESTSINPETPYAAFKAASEYLIQQSLDDARRCTFRLSNLFGLGQEKGVVAYLLRFQDADDPLRFNNDGKLVRYFLHVQDAADALLKAVDISASGVYNVVGSDRYVLRDLVALVERISGITRTVIYDGPPPWENVRTFDTLRSNSLFGAVPAGRLESFIKHYLADNDEG